MSESFVVRESRPGGVVLLQLDRPPLNALCIALLQELAAHARDIAADPEVKAVVVTGSERAFAAGADVSEFTERRRRPCREPGVPRRGRRARARSRVR